jgi:MFS family permease
MDPPGVWVAVYAWFVPGIGCAMHAAGAAGRFRAPVVRVSDRSVFWVLAAVFSTSLGVGLIFGFEPPLIAMVLNRGGHSSFLIGTVIAVSLVAVILIGPFYPRVISRIGLQRSVVGGIGCGVLILLAMPVWTGVGAWMVLRVLTGCVLGLSWIASEIWMNRVAGGTSRGTVMGIYGTIFSLGVAAGPFLLEFTGTFGARPFLIGAAVLATTLLPLALLRQAAASSAAQPDETHHSLRELAAFLPAAPTVMLAAAVAGSVEAADLTLLPLLGLHDGLDEPAALLLVTVFLAGNVALQLPIGMLADRIGRRLMLGICALVSGCGPLLLQGCIGKPLLLWPLLFCWGGTLYAFYSQGIALLGDEIAPRNLAGANTLFVMVYCCGGILGPSIGGLMMDLSPGNGLPLMLAVPALILCAVLFGGLVLGRRTQQTPSA